MKTGQFRTLIAAALATLSIGAAAQTPGKVYRVGYVTINASGPGTAADLDGLGRNLARHGYSVGVNLAIESRFAESSEAKSDIPVMFPPGRPRLATRPVSTGSPASTTMGTVLVPSLAARAAG